MNCVCNTWFPQRLAFTHAPFRGVPSPRVSLKSFQKEFHHSPYLAYYFPDETEIESYYAEVHVVVPRQRRTAQTVSPSCPPYNAIIVLEGGTNNPTANMKPYSEQSCPLSAHTSALIIVLAVRVCYMVDFVVIWFNTSFERSMCFSWRYFWWCQIFCHLKQSTHWLVLLEIRSNFITYRLVTRNIISNMSPGPEVIKPFSCSTLLRLLVF